MVKQYKGINIDIKRVLQLASERIIEQYQANINTTRYPMSITELHEKDTKIIDRLKKAIKQ